VDRAAEVRMIVIRRLARGDEGQLIEFDGVVAGGISLSDRLSECLTRT